MFVIPPHHIECMGSMHPIRCEDTHDINLFLAKHLMVISIPGDVEFLGVGAGAFWHQVANCGQSSPWHDRQITYMMPCYAPATDNRKTNLVHSMFPEVEM